MISDRLPSLTPGDRSISASEFNNLSRAVRALQNIHGVSSYNSFGITLRPPHQRRQVPPVAPDRIEVVLIVGYDNVGNNQNAAFRCQRMNESGEPTGEAFRVRAHSRPNWFLEDLTECVPSTEPGQQIPAMMQRVKMPNQSTVQRRWMCTWWFQGKDVCP